MVKKQSLGRKKIEIKRITCEATRQVTFSKRRAGLFNKANELCTLCGVQIAILVFSPAGKIFSFGHPDVNPILDRFFYENNPPQGAPEDASRGGILQELSRRYSELLNLLGTEKKRAEEFNQSTHEENQTQPWWEAPIDDMGLFELQQLFAFMDGLTKSMTRRVEELVVNPAVASHYLAMNSEGMADHFAAARADPNHASSSNPLGRGLP